MYFRHFGLSGPPFQFTIAPAALFRGREHAEALAALEWGLIHEPSGYTLLVGEPGMGKTTLICSILSRRYQDIHAAYLNYPKLPVIDLFRMALRQLGIDPPPASKLDCIEALKLLVHRTPNDERVAFVMDEAQGLNDEAFEEMRLLANYVNAGQHNVQMVLVGQPSLLDRLESAELRQLAERIGTRVALNPLTPDETQRYIEHRLRTRSGTSERVFTRSALRRIVLGSRGIPRRINVLCHNSMLAAYSAGNRRVGPKEVRAVVDEYEDLQSISKGNAPAPRRAWYRFWRAAKSAATINAFGAAVGGLSSVPLDHSRAAAGSGNQPSSAVNAGALKSSFRR